MEGGERGTVAGPHRRVGKHVPRPVSRLNRLQRVIALRLCGVTECLVQETAGQPWICDCGAPCDAVGTYEIGHHPCAHGVRVAASLPGARRAGEECAAVKPFWLET